MTEEELETHTIAAWKEGKAHICRQYDGIGRQYPRPLVQVRLAQLLSTALTTDLPMQLPLKYHLLIIFFHFENVSVVISNKLLLKCFSYLDSHISKVDLNI